MCHITLDDGTILDANLNANTWESPTEIAEDIFEDNISDVSYEDEDGAVVHLGECKLVWMGEYDGKWMFGLNPLTDEEKAALAIAQSRADIDYISAMTGVDL